MKKVIISTVVVVLLLAVGITTLVLGLIPVGMNDVINMPDKVYIYCENTKDLPDKRLSLKSREENDLKKISNIYTTFNRCFQQKALKALFNNEFGKGIDSNYNEVSQNLSKNFDSSTKFTVVFCFKDGNEQTIKADNKTYKYNRVYFELTNDGTWQDVVMAVTKESNTSDSSSISRISYNYYYSSKANFKELYDYVKNLVPVIE